MTKKHGWIKDYSGDTIEIIIRDSSMNKMESWVINTSDKKRAKDVMRILKNSYGVDFGVSDNKDLDWLRK